MIEIVFGDSACGSLKMAQNYGKGKYQGGCIGVIISHADGSKPSKREIKAAKREAEEKERLAWENAAPLGGNSADICGFSLKLSIGDISEEQPGIKRMQALERLYSIYPNDEGQQLAQEILKSTNENLKKVKERIAEGESLRIWYSNQPDEMCGFYWFMYLLNQWEVSDEQVFIVKLPEWEAHEKGTIVRKTNWGETAPEEWNRYIELQKTVPQIFIQSCASHWLELKGENAPLRIVLNGQLVNSSEKIYDDFILREIAAENEEFQEAMIIGRVLGKYQLGISDSWVAFRIEEMIHAGKLTVMSSADEDMPVYHRRLKKSI
ncbi:DUF3658 domain-containing protein [Sedimentibacter sp.]|uniref:DUF3658 domain-containing protein n=1 Tax=Sedimentibacter sp. TaxID=1960295 RepID=UPI0028B19098|nr:DUF3658 domain-containing protein [Sedimentibacter sp.]